jgi:type IV pilus assembly protein PilA
MLQKMKKRLKNQRGMTLVELLAVIVILGIISAIAVPNIGGLISKTKDDAKVAEGIQIINAAKLYSTTHPIPDSDTDGKVTIDQDKLSGYLDNLKDDDGFTVVVEKSDNDNKYTYRLKDHDAVTLAGGDATGVTEDQLLKYSGN